jgi:sterol 3beta-glucosyltransferase
MEYAKSLIKRKDPNTEEVLDDIEESWTFIGDDNDPQLVGRIQNWEPRGTPGYPKDKSDESPRSPRSTTPMPFNKGLGSK